MSAADALAELEWKRARFWRWKVQRTVRCGCHEIIFSSSTGYTPCERCEAMLQRSKDRIAPIQRHPSEEPE